MVLKSKETSIFKFLISKGSVILCKTVKSKIYKILISIFYIINYGPSLPKR
jgi:hypothetical protein